MAEITFVTLLPVASLHPEIYAKTRRGPLNGEGHLRNVKDPRAAANRIRVATQSLTDPHDVQVVRQYLQELEKLAREQEAEAIGRRTSKAPYDDHEQRPGGDLEAGTQIGGPVVPLSGSPIRGHLRKASPSAGRVGEWVLRLGEANLSDE